MERIDQRVAADLWADRLCVPLAQAVVEKSCPFMGLDRRKTGRLTMAVEEVVMHLADTTPGTAVHIDIIPGGWHVKAALSFTADPSSLWAMNLCAGSRVPADPALSNLGLVLAARMTDRFAIRLDGGIVRLTLRQDLDYPTIDPGAGRPVDGKGTLSIEPDPDPSLVKEACIRAAECYAPQDLHQTFFEPGKLADMIARNDMNMAVALTGDGEVAGAICWQGGKGQSLTFFGPYSFETGKRCPALLTEHMIQRAARTKALGLFSGRATADLPPGDFECLGSLESGPQSSEGNKAVKVWYRHLGEDPGALVWSHPGLVSFLEAQYKSLVLMRQIRPVQDLGEAIPDRSVVSARLRPRLSEAVLMPLVGGRDMGGCLAKHVNTLKAEGYASIVFLIDLAKGWQAATAGPAMENGFKPRMVLPHGGTSDMVVFQHEAV